MYEMILRIFAGVGIFTFMMAVAYVFACIHDRWPGTDIIDKDDHS